jgi:hypothetical protein
MSLAILTCVTNGGGYGPGHTALVMDGTVYSFEPNAQNVSGWYITAAGPYIAHNSSRPVILQYLSGFNQEPILARIRWELDKPAWWGTTGGVCSQAAAYVLNRGAPSGFDPDGYDTPYRVYWHAWAKHYVSYEKCIWPIASSGVSSGVRQRILQKLFNDYGFGESDCVDS